MPLYVRVFASGDEEHRGDSLDLGAAAYTEANVPRSYAGQAWRVEVRPWSVPDDENPPVLSAGRVGGQDLAGGQLAADRLTLRGTSLPAAESEVVVDDVLRLLGGVRYVAAVRGDATPVTTGPAVLRPLGRIPILVDRDGVVRYLWYYGQ